MSNSVRAGCALALAVAGLALAACGDTVIDETKAEDVVFADLERNDVKVQSVDCPGNVDVERGKTFDCTVTVAGEGREATATLKILNEDADLHHVSFRLQPEK